MSGKRNHRRRYNLKIEYARRFEDWLAWEPPYWRIFSRAYWKKQRPQRTW